MFRHNRHYRFGFVNRQPLTPLPPVQRDMLR
jgi:hypothetical protein